MWSKAWNGTRGEARRETRREMWSETHSRARSEAQHEAHIRARREAQHEAHLDCYKDLGTRGQEAADRTASSLRGRLVWDFYMAFRVSAKLLTELCLLSPLV